MEKESVILLKLRLSNFLLIVLIVVFSLKKRIVGYSVPR
jgi:hypothetical protein